MLYREADAEAIVERIQALIDKLDDATLGDELAKPLIFQIASLFEELIQMRAANKRLKTATDPADCGVAAIRRTASR